MNVNEILERSCVCNSCTHENFFRGENEQSILLSLWKAKRIITSDFCKLLKLFNAIIINCESNKKKAHQVYRKTSAFIDIHCGKTR